MKARLILMSLICASGVALLSGCSTVTPKCTAVEDNSLHHYRTGMKALEDGNVPAAHEKFERALYCDEEFGGAHSGLAIVSAEKAKTQADAGFKAVEAERATAELKKARSLASRPEQLFDYYAAVIRVDTIMKPNNWLADAESAFGEGSVLNVDERTLVYYQGTEALSYFMGIAWLEGKKFPKARDSFSAVLTAKRDGKWHEKADRGWKRVDKIVRAMSGITLGDVGASIATSDRISRADLAALVSNELNIDKVMAGRIPRAGQSAKKAEFTPADMTSHPFREEVLTLMKWNIRGMEPKYDETTRAYLFKPGDPVSRGEMALVLEDVLVKLSGDEKVATAFFGQENSPFPDVKATSAFYNAVMNMTTRNIMESELTGEFRVNAPVDGAEALLAIRVLKQKMTTY
jgi:hypothetical protein